MLNSRMYGTWHRFRSHNFSIMNSLPEVYRNKWAVWWRRHSTALQVGATISCNLAYFTEAGYLRTAVILSMISLGSATLYYFVNRRYKIKPRDLLVITGCNSGLGYSLAMYYRAQGATVLAGVHKTGITQRPSAVEALESKGVIVHSVDVTNQKSVCEFSEKVKSLLEERQLALRALVNNAGVMIFGEFEWQTQNQMEQQVNVNLLGTMRITQELMPIIRRYGSRIIVITSHCALDPLPGVSVYSATKAALHAWTTSLRVEVSKHGINVVSFMPGGFITESNIMKRQQMHFNEMEQCMSKETKQYYGDYFTRYANYFSGFTSAENEDTVKIVSNPRIYEVFDNALCDIYPSAIYKCESWRYFFYCTLFKITPVWLRDRLVQRFVYTPPWRVNKQ